MKWNPHVFKLESKFLVAETKMDQKKSAQVNIAIPLPRTSHRMHRPGAAFATSSAIRATCSSERAISSATCSGRPTVGYRGGSSDFRRFFRFTHVHPESGVHLFIAILSSKDTWLLRKIENLSNTNAQNGRSKRREFQDLINKRAGISNKINKDEDLFHQQPCVFHLYQWYTNDQ